MAGNGPIGNPRPRRRNADTLTGAKSERCPECSTPRREGDTCEYCGTPASEAPGGSPRGAAPTEAPEMPTPKKWHVRTREWWDAWTRSAQSTVFEPSDWEILKNLLPLVDAMNRENEDPLKRAKLFDHIHKAERSLGGTHMERLRGRIDVSGSAPAGGVAHGDDGDTEEGVAILDDYREMFA